MTVNPLFQQSLEPTIGRTRSESACLPTCFYMLGRAYGYLQDVSIEEFISSLEGGDSYTPGTGWIRPRMSAELRRRYKMNIVSWKLRSASGTSEDDVERMVAAGYLGTQQEIAWYQKYVVDWPLDVVVAAGTPVIATMAPGFGVNTSVHAVILASLTNDQYEVIDPDERNGAASRIYTIEQIHRVLSPLGAGSVILPPR